MLGMSSSKRKVSAKSSHLQESPKDEIQTKTPQRKTKQISPNNSWWRDELGTGQCPRGESKPGPDLLWDGGNELTSWCGFNIINQMLSLLQTHFIESRIKQHKEERQLFWWAPAPLISWSELGLHSVSFWHFNLHLFVFPPTVERVSGPTDTEIIWAKTREQGEQGEFSLYELQAQRHLR